EEELKKWFSMETVTTEIAAKIFHRKQRQIQRWIESGDLKRQRHGYVSVEDLYNFARSLKNMDKFEHVWKNYERLVIHKPKPAAKAAKTKKRKHHGKA
ncbi:hypothetical protein L0244_22040, partial [bacterium]|nr:hypothetical protein [bacterium]